MPRGRSDIFIRERRSRRGRASSELIAESDDVVGAFFDDICVGFINADPNGYTTVPLMGNDGGDYDYLNVGEIPDLFVYDASNGSILPITHSSELAGWAINEIFTIDATSAASNTFGCTDDAACNYDSDATADDDSCLYNDCFGECGGSAVVDDCDVCNGGNADQDCAGVCFGDSSIDGCGVCDDDSANDNLSCTGCTDECADNYDSGKLGNLYSYEVIQIIGCRLNSDKMMSLK